jgi:hypothetical protein
MDYPLIHFTEVFKQPDAGAAVNGRNKQPYFTDPPVGEFEKAITNVEMIEISIFLTDFSLFYFDARMVSNIVILAGIAFFQYLINSLASKATE